VQILEYFLHRHPLQVWYSAAWTRATQDAFRAAVTAVLANGAGSAGDVRVQELLRHWQGANVGLAAGRRQWLESRDNGVYIANFKHQADR
jgi:hypothetical protein